MNRNLKTAILFAFSFAVVFSLAACNNKTTKSQATTTKAQATTTVAQVTTAVTTTPAPETQAPTTVAPVTQTPTTVTPTTVAPTTVAPTTAVPTTTVAPHQHVYSEFNGRLEPTCVVSGHVGYYECVECHKYFDANLQEIDEIVIPVVDHTYGELNIGYPATCTTEGRYDYKVCQVCEQLFTQDNVLIESTVIECVEHKYSDLHEKVNESCFANGYIAYYSCENCEKRFDENKVEVSSIAIPSKGHHTYLTDQDTCTACGLKKTVISVSEAKATITTNTKFDITAIVAGVTSTYDGGYMYLILKDLYSNELIGVRKQVVKDGLDNEDRNMLDGSSYAPKMPFNVGDIVQFPVSLLQNGTSVGGNNLLRYLVYRGEDISTFESQEAYLEKYVIDSSENYEINIDDYTVVIHNTEELTSFLKDGDNQWKLVVLKGTEENPINFVTRTLKDTLQYQREYVMPYYGSASALADLKVNGAYPVFSNFGNTFNLSNTLSALLFGQTEYEAANYQKPYQYKGEIYATIVGGSTSYYHFIVLNQDSIKNDNSSLNSEVSATVATNAFFKAMEQKASELGINIRKSITSAVGVSGVIGTEDLCKIGIALTKNQKAMEAWSNVEYIGSWKDSKGEIQSASFDNAVFVSDDAKTHIIDVFGENSLIGGKGGSLKYTEARGYAIQNIVYAFRGPDNTTIVVAIVMSLKDNVHTDDVKHHQAAILYQILSNKYQGKPTADLEAQLNCAACAGVVLPAENAPANGYDWFGESSSVIHYSINGDAAITTASVWKMMTCLTSLDYVTPDHYNDEILVLKTDLSSVANSAYPKCVGGEVCTYDLLLHSMMRRSSNVAPTVIARYVGTKIVLGEFKKASD